MTEAQWDSCTEPKMMLEFLRDSETASERKLRLFAAACCRRAWHRLDTDGRAVIEASERFADGMATQTELMAAVWSSRGTLDLEARAAVDAAAVGAWRPVVALLTTVSNRPPGTAASPVASAALDRERAVQVALLRDIVGDPLEGARAEAAWLEWNGGLVLRLANAAYDDRLLPSGQLDPRRLAVLADVLLDAGSSPDSVIVRHLRTPGTHARGCFALDCIMGKERPRDRCWLGRHRTGATGRF